MAIQALASVAILLALGLVTFWVLRLGVRPVQQMTATATAFGEGDLSARIPDSAPGTEAGELGVALNQMLGRIETAFDEQRRSEDRLRRFVADASHELRTPVTTIRGYAELYRHGGLGDEAALAEAMRRTEMEATRMGDLVADLLALARLDQGRPIDAPPVDLTTLAVDAVADARAVDPDRPIELETNLTADSAIVIGDDAHLRQVLGNLVTNARVHTPPGTPCGCGSAPSPTTPSSRSPTPAPAWPPPTPSEPSSASTGRTRRGLGPRAARGSACRSSRRWSTPTAAPPSWSPPPARGRPCGSGCRSPPRRTATVSDREGPNDGVPARPDVSATSPVAHS